jgi:hypothetical protein
MRKSCLLSIVIGILGWHAARAEEGLWIPMLIEKYQIGQMKEAGLVLDAEDIYQVNRECLKDAIVRFGRGCTGEMVSPEGLVLTNHHCGEGEIQSLSTLEHNYLRDGFWALEREQELPCPGLTVTFLRRMEDVTGEVNRGLQPGMDPMERERRMELNQGEIIREAVEGTYLGAEVKSFYYGNAYYLFVYETFRDVRLAGAPPVSIGSFGGDDENWMWPRHTGDFSLFRVYADADNLPAGYSPDNRPYRPRKYLEINAGGIREGDYTMVLGYPAKTTRYLHSEAVRSMMQSSLPRKIRLRTTRLEIMDSYMSASEKVELQYFHKHTRVSNSWKKWQGVVRGLQKNHALEKKKEEEEAFSKWVNGDGERQWKYDRVLEGFEKLYGEMEPYVLAEDMMTEAIMAVEVFGQAGRIRSMMKQGLPANTIREEAEEFFRDYCLPLDRDLFAAMMEAYREEMPPEFHPGFFSLMSKRKYKGDFSRLAGEVFSRSVFSDRDRTYRLIGLYEKSAETALDRIEKDPVSGYMSQLRLIYFVQVNPVLYDLREEEEGLYKTYMAGLLEMYGDSLLYPDANRTMRLSYGKVQGYRPRNGVLYACATTLAGLLEKENPEDPDFRLPEKLVSLYEDRDYGPWGVNGTMPVCFIASNHTSGGNSGSPVLDAEGRLIGINFDREWEGTMSDVLYDPDLCRNIAVDIRYVLFIMDRYAGASSLVEEMDIVF